MMLNQELVGNQGTIITVPNDTRQQILADVTLRDPRSPRTLAVSICDVSVFGLVSTQDFQKLIVFEYGHDGMALGSGLLDLGHNRVFTVQCSRLRVKAACGGGVAGQSARLGAFVTIGGGPIPALTSTYFTLAAGGVQTVLPFFNQLNYEILTDSPFTVDYLNSAGATIFTKTFGAGSPPVDLRPCSQVSSYVITNIGVAAATFLCTRTLQF